MSWSSTRSTPSADDVNSHPLSAFSRMWSGKSSKSQQNYQGTNSVVIRQHISDDGTKDIDKIMYQVEQELARATDLVETEDQTHWILDSYTFTGLVGCGIFLNTVVMGLETELPQHHVVWLVFEHFFTFFFLVEMIVKLSILGKDYFRDAQNWLDAFIVTMSVMDVWVLTVLIGRTKGKNTALQDVSIFRVLRLLRLIRVLRLIRHVPRLIVVISSLMSAMATAFWTAMVVLICVYVGGIFCTEYIGRFDPSIYPGYKKNMVDIDAQEMMLNFNPYTAFGSLSKSMLTLFNIAILSEWTEVVRPVSIKQPFFLIFFIMFALFTSFGVMNVMVGMIVDNVAKESARVTKKEMEMEKKRKLHCLDKCRKLMEDIDKDDDKVISKEELQACMDSDQEHDILHMIDKVKLPHCMTPGEMLFMLDSDGDGKLSYNEFVRSFFRLIESDEYQQHVLLQIGINHLKNLVSSADDAARSGLNRLREEVRNLAQDRENLDESDVKQAKDAGNYDSSKDTDRQGESYWAPLIMEAQKKMEQKLIEMDSTIQSIAREMQTKAGDNLVAQAAKEVGASLVDHCMQKVTSPFTDPLKLPHCHFDTDSLCEAITQSTYDPLLQHNKDLAVFHLDVKSSGEQKEQLIPIVIDTPTVAVHETLHKCTKHEVRFAEPTSPLFIEAPPLVEQKHVNTSTKYEVHFEEHTPLGMDVRHKYPSIAEVDAGGMAKRHGVREGDAVISINGIDTLGRPRKEIVNALRHERPLTLLLKRNHLDCM